MIQPKHFPPALHQSEILKCKFTEVSRNFQAVLCITSKQAHGKFLWKFPKILEHSRQLCFNFLYSCIILIEYCFTWLMQLQIRVFPCQFRGRNNTHRRAIFYINKRNQVHDFSARWPVCPSVNNLHMTMGSF
jgi:hypothetical protein